MRLCPAQSMVAHLSRVHTVRTATISPGAVLSTQVAEQCAPRAAIGICHREITQTLNESMLSIRQRYHSTFNGRFPWPLHSPRRSTQTRPTAPIVHLEEHELIDNTVIDAQSISADPVYLGQSKREKIRKKTHQCV
jgi:hypothetical protein